jgi:hypothetical protein
MNINMGLVLAPIYGMDRASTPGCTLQCHPFGFGFFGHFGQSGCFATPAAQKWQKPLAKTGVISVRILSPRGGFSTKKDHHQSKTLLVSAPQGATQIFAFLFKTSYLSATKQKPLG